MIVRSHGTMPLDFGSLVKDALVLDVLPPRKGHCEALHAAGARDVLSLTWRGPEHPTRIGEQHVAGRFRRPSDVACNNCTVAALHGIAGLALFNKRFLSHFKTILVPKNAGLAASLPGLLRYSRGKGLMRLGTTTIPGLRRTYLVYASKLRVSNARRLYGPTGLSPADILRSLSGLDYTLLRWVEDIEAGHHEGDLDILVSSATLPALRERLGTRIGTYPVDVYTDDGTGGHTYKNVPYFAPHMARLILASATERPSGLRSPSPRWRYLLFCYHLLFHGKSERIPPRTEEIGAETYRSPHYYQELARLAAAAGEPVPHCVSDLERALEREGVLPGRDLIAFYSARNPFLKARYLGPSILPPGLSVFFVRDFGEGPPPIDEIRSHLAGKFRILVEGPVQNDQKERILHGARGGNWSDRTAAGGVAEPVYWFVCWDDTPVPPSRSTRRKYPQLDNENIRLKSHIRHTMTPAGTRRLRLLHSSDNSGEAWEHIELLGLSSHPQILARFPAGSRPAPTASSA